VSTNGVVKLGTGTLSGATGTLFVISGGNCLVTTTAISRRQAQSALERRRSHRRRRHLGGNLTATNGTGLQFDNADSSYTSAASSISATRSAAATPDRHHQRSAGSVTIANTSSAISNPSGMAVNIANSSASFSYAERFPRPMQA
jgi:hypothetical protein